MNDNKDLAFKQTVKKPNVKPVLVYFVGLGLYFGGFAMIHSLFLSEARGFSDGSSLYLLIVPGLAGLTFWGISQYKKWGWMLGLIVSWYFIIVIFFLSFRYLILVTRNFSLGLLFSLFILIGILVVSIMAVKFLSKHKYAFS